ncbi:MAG TPA: protein kinase [Gemmataceae bacterium]|nr:protein kinase [Gemmataceae bacterium]
MRHTVPLQTGLEPFPGYRLRRLLGYGSFAEVWEAEAADGTLCALKFLPAEREQATPSELRSLQAIRQLLHPNLLRIDRVWCHLGYIVIAMERADGTLADLNATSRTETGCVIIPEHACLLLSQAAAALDFLNARQHHVEGKTVSIQHCDVKPSNLMLFGETVKLADFGLAALMSGPVVPHRPSGTPEYAAPEVFRGRLSRFSDQFALAVSYCELRGGRLPFDPPPRTFHPDYFHPPPNLSMLSAVERPIVARALAIAAEERWPSCVEFIDRVARLFL